jgi:hypothetical protein
MPDRYADAVRARRAELRARRALLAGGHRAELRTRLALARIAATAEIAGELAGLGRELRAHADRSDRRTRERLPDLVGRAAQVLAHRARGRRERLLAEIRVIAGSRGLLPGLHWPASAVAVPGPSLPAPAGGPSALLTGLLDGAGWWRVAPAVLGLPVLGLPVLGLPVPGGLGPATAAVSAGLAVAALAAAVAARRAAADRARWRAWGIEAVAALRVHALTDLDSWLVGLEARVLADLDRAAVRAAAQIDAELAALTPAVTGAR